MKHLRRFDKMRGSVAIEFALVVPLLVSLFLGAIGFGYSFHTYSRLEEAVRAGARYASMLKYDAYEGPDPGLTPCPNCTVKLSGGGANTFLAKVRNVTVCGYADCTGRQPIVEGLAPENVDVELGISYTDVVNVAVSVTNFRLNLLVGSVPLNGKPITRFPYIPQAQIIKDKGGPKT